MQKNTNIDKKIPVTMRATGYMLNVQVSNSGVKRSKDIIHFGLWRILENTAYERAENLKTGFLPFGSVGSAD